MSDVGATLGVEEEYHLVDAATGALADAPEVVDAAVRVLGEQAQHEISTSQLEIATPVSTSLGGGARAPAAAAAGVGAGRRGSGCAVLARARTRSRPGTSSG